MDRQFNQIAWDKPLEDDLAEILRLAVREDLGSRGDWTTAALVPEDASGKAAVIARQAGVVAGLPGVRMALEAVDDRLCWSPQTHDGQAVRPGQRIAVVEGPAGGLLRAERLVLNLLGRLSGIATLTCRYVEAAAGTEAKIYDTRKTTPGWRRLEKYAVRCGGGCNHRTGLFEAVLIKDNHLALGAGPGGGGPIRYTPAEAVERARRFLKENLEGPDRSRMIIEVEVDTLKQLEEVLPSDPDIVLLDNMSPTELGQAVAVRDALRPEVELEASGGVDLDTLPAVAASGVERISVGALTHSASWLNLGMDWLSE